MILRDGRTWSLYYGLVQTSSDKLGQVRTGASSIFWLKAGKFRSPELYGAPLEGLTNFLNHGSTCRMSMESYRLAELKYTYFSRTGRKTKNLRHSEIFLWLVFEHGLLEGSTILLQYSALTRTLLESSRLGKLQYANSAG